MNSMRKVKLVSIILVGLTIGLNLINFYHNGIGWTVL